MANGGYLNTHVHSIMATYARCSYCIQLVLKAQSDSYSYRSLQVGSELNVRFAKSANAQLFEVIHGR